MAKKKGPVLAVDWAKAIGSRNGWISHLNLLKLKN